MSQKTYVAHRAGLSLSREIPTDVVGKSRTVTVAFDGGRRTTDDEAEQKWIESLPAFKEHWITLEDPADLIAQAETKAKSLRAAAKEADDAAKAAEAELASLKGPAKKEAVAAK